MSRDLTTRLPDPPPPTPEERTREYHLAQHKEPYRSTVHFCDWVEEMGRPGKGDLILDLGCGSGANLAYMARRWPKARFQGMDLDHEAVCLGQEQCGADNLCLMTGDLFAVKDNLPTLPAHERLGLVSLQTIMMLDWREAFAALLSARPDWLAVSSIFYDGPVEFSTLITEYDAQEQPMRSYHFNVCPLPLLEGMADEYGYEMEARPFEIDIDLPRPLHKSTGTYTVNSEAGRLQFTGAMHLPWWFVWMEPRD